MAKRLERRIAFLEVKVQGLGKVLGTRNETIRHLQGQIKMKENAAS